MNARSFRERDGWRSFPQRLGLNLADAVRRSGLLRTTGRLLQACARNADPLQSEAHLDDFFFRVAACSACAKSCLKVWTWVDYRFGRRNYRAVFDEVAQVRIFLFADGRFEGDWLLRNLQDLADFCYRNVHPLSDFFGGWFASQFLAPAAARCGSAC